ncbi:hypothetical protein JCM10207_007599 [Rhodosporidiobolus poonsookiae]
MVPPSPAKGVRVCTPCHQRKVSCDLLRPSCTACIKYARSRPAHICEYGPGAANPGEAKSARDRLEAETEQQLAALSPARTRSETKALDVFEHEADEEIVGEERDEKVNPGEGEGHSIEEERQIKPRPVLPRLSFPSSYPTFPLTLPLPSLPRAPLPPTPVTPHFVSVFAPTPPTLAYSSSPVLSPRPASGVRRPSFPDEATLFDPRALAPVYLGSRFSISPPSSRDGQPASVAVQQVDYESAHDERIFAYQ